MSIVLYPVFVYMYLYMLMLDYWTESKEFFIQFSKDFVTNNKDELILLEDLKKTTLFDQEVFKKYMENKCALSLSAYSYKLLLHFLQLRMLVILLHIFNMHIKFQVTSDRWVSEKNSTKILSLPFTIDRKSVV